MTNRKVIRRYTRCRPWTTVDIRKLKELRSTHTNRQIGEILGRASNSISYMSCRLGLVSKAAKKWTHREIVRMCDMYEDGARLKIIARELDRTVKAVDQRLTMLVRSQGYVRRGRQRGKIWKI